MKICIICGEIFAWGKYGGFGRVARTIGREIAGRGLEVSAVVPRRGEQKPVEYLDGMTVYSFPQTRPLEAGSIFRKCNADIYHSEEPSLSTFIAQKAMPYKKHFGTVQDPKSLSDIITELRSPSINIVRSALGFLYENNFLVKKAVHGLDAIYCRVKFIQKKTKAIYSLKSEPGFLPTPISLSRGDFQKSKNPTVCLVGRWDRRKRPEIFFELAKKFPTVTFIAAGESQDKARDQALRNRYAGLHNLKMPGLLDQFSGNHLEKLYEKSWILVNTSTREGLPNAFLEAMAHKCAIVSHVNPENTASCFGYHVRDNNFEKGLTSLLQNDRWKKKGEAAFVYVKENYDFEKAIDAHIYAYEKLLK